MSSKPTLVLVHGAWHGTWFWEPFVPELRRHGLDVQLVELTSHGTDPATVGDLRSDVALVRETVRAIDGPVVLVGHSFGGVVVTEASAELPNVTQLIYVAAFLPRVGDSMRALTGGGNAPWIEFKDGLISVAAGWGSKLFYSDVDADVAAGAEARLQPQSAASFGQEVLAAGWQTIPSTYVVTTQDQSVPTGLQREMLARAGITDVAEFDSGHSPFLNHPAELADLLHSRLV
ncbi:alpha/beta hydrolase [Longispora sp. NPDC051575]|uniref:alpha/beta hydrolase n=1 Tax=Longispora sp. NPDC051575 TaxID=3154943 RepID=UPI00344640F0